jgi:predicted nucleic acid-binding protein
MIFVDSNIWCYYLDKRLPEHESTRESLREMIRSEEIVCNTIVVLEVAHYLVRHFKEKDARKKLETFVNLRNMEIVDFNRQLLAETLEKLISSYSDGLGGRDASVVATMNLRGIKSVVSHDDVFKRLSSKLALKVIDPVCITSK